jgi:hypothetical protein
MSGEQQRAVRYLLGTLPEQEADALAEEMFTNDETFAALEEAQDALIEVYLDGELASDDRQRFESLVRSSSHLNERVELERALRARPSAARPPRPALRFLPWAAAVAMGLTGGGLALQANREAARAREDFAVRENALTARIAERDARVRALEGRIAEQEASQIEIWRLSGGNERGAGGAASFAITNRWVRLRVEENRAPANATYRARIETAEAREVFRVDGLAAGSGADQAFVDVIVPGSVMPRGTYILYLTRVGPGGAQERGPYSFSVRPR